MQMRGFGASSVSHQRGKGTKCWLFQGKFLGKGLWGKVGHGHVVGHHAVWGKIPGKMPLGKSATVVGQRVQAIRCGKVGRAWSPNAGLQRLNNPEPRNAEQGRKSLEPECGIATRLR